MEIVINAAIAERFDTHAKFLRAERYGMGHINDTFAAYFDNGKRYILQRINSTLFRDVPQLMSNICLVTEFNRAEVIKRGGDPDRECLTVVPTVDGAGFYFDGKNYFRMYIFIEGATTYQIVESPQDFYESAVAFGGFANMLAKFDAKKLYEVLPDFHNTRVRYQTFERAVAEDKLKRAATVAEEVAFVQQRKGICGRIVDLLASGAMPTKVTHNDTKLNNVMIDDVTHRAVAVIDLDTIMPGSLCYDFGDSIRFGCNPAPEDEPDLSVVNFRTDLFQEYAKGYLGAIGKSITSVELENLAFGAILMTYECGMRFLADYLSGDTYFRTHRPGQNLDRARTQFKLVEDMESSLDTLNHIVFDLADKT